MSSQGNVSAHLLIVDDTTQSVQILGKALREEGYEITVAHNGQQACKVLEKVLPDLILLDVMMPLMDGFATCQQLKVSSKTQNIPVIFLTALNGFINLVKGLEYGAVDYITKPFNTHEVLARVKTHLILKQNQENLLNNNAQQKELIHILCHDLSNPIGAIMNFLKLAKARPSLLSNQIDLMLSMVTNAMNLIELVRQMKDLDEKNLPLKSIFLSEALKASQTILETQFAKKNIELQLQLEEGLQVQVEEISFINSVLNNIFTNAIKFSFPHSKVMVQGYQEEETTILRIRDFGIGMDSALLETLFDAGKSTSRPGTTGELGTGFGMLLIQKFMVAYGGTLKLSSKPQTQHSEDHGTEVVLTLKSA